MGIILPGGISFFTSFSHFLVVESFLALGVLEVFFLIQIDSQTTTEKDLKMSYCRWSSDNFNCDLYCFEHVGGYWQTYVAGSRHRVWFRIFHWITDKRFRFEDGSCTFRTSRFQTWKWPKWLTHKYIRHPLAGESFQDSSEDEMFRRIVLLHRQGFRVPQRVLDRCYGLKQKELNND